MIYIIKPSFFWMILVIKNQKTKYNKQKLTLKIYSFVIMHCWNVNVMLADKKKADIIIARVKFQFY